MSHSKLIKLSVSSEGLINGYCSNCQTYISVRPKEAKDAALAAMGDSLAEMRRDRDRWLEIYEEKLKAKEKVLALRKEIQEIKASLGSSNLITDLKKAKTHLEKIISSLE